ncbi:hypothetical protein HH212_08645 [Massilia forsythiae]|uniref:TonB C-terminal domain-containing protein n=1 Tax=Massilia forsythiae TaxID=2728020 RepID=A0A7Z2ZS42_9BURK|nr:hypothetical protein [Massilia forsythiae]QJE00088.1 hypothetical protein HH212_08645 [Massilia forsythiae]
MKITLFLGLTLCAGAALAQDPAAAGTPTYGAADCKVGKLLPPPAGGAVQWRGNCKDGFADGPGVLEWTTKDGTALRLEAAFARGAVVGEGKLRAGGRFDYIGTLVNGMPDGEGYLKFADGHRYEGGIRHMQREGQGTLIYPNGDVYQGGFHDNKLSGTGRLTFALGGKIEGEFKDGKPDAKAKITYAGSGREAEFGNLRHERAQEEDGKPLAFQIREDEPHLGTLLRKATIKSSVPLTSNWKALSEAQKDVVRSHYPALEEGDEPPFPVRGEGELLKVLHAVGNRYNATGMLRLNVLVGADGKAKQVARVGDFDQDVVRYAASAAMVQEYKPALCHGAPCEMMYALRVNLVRQMP